MFYSSLSPRLLDLLVPQMAALGLGGNPTGTSRKHPTTNEGCDDAGACGKAAAPVHKLLPIRGYEAFVSRGAGRNFPKGRVFRPPFSSIPPPVSSSGAVSIRLHLAISFSKLLYVCPVFLASLSAWNLVGRREKWLARITNENRSLAFCVKYCMHMPVIY